ncbi:MAG: TraR/DksA family transcriptional regulator [Acidimicrobiaceae bacterium]|nr:TraR/DksA family transcriptional regulator [Acidimicrobiaceae bacterium]
MANEAPTIDYRALLEEERASLAGQLSELGFGGLGAGLAYDSNFADTSQVTAERGEAEALARELRDALADVERALGKLGQGTYGVCERCGEQIVPARLEAMPAVKTCIRCASASR